MAGIPNIGANPRNSARVAVDNRRADEGRFDSSLNKIHIFSTNSAELWPTSAKHSGVFVYFVVGK